MNHTRTFKFAKTIILGVTLASMAASRNEAALVASDTASNYGGAWAGNGGTGFDTWVFRNVPSSGSAGQFLANTGTHGDLNFIWSTPDFKAWGTFANGGGFQEAVAFRGFGFTGSGWANALNEAGDTFEVSFEHGGIDAGGGVGFTLRTGNSDAGAGNYNTDARFEFGFIGGTASYSYFDSTGQHLSGIPFTQDGLDVDFQLTSLNTYSFQVFNANGGALLGTFAGTLGGPLNTTIDSVALYNRNAEQANAYFNKLAINDFEAAIPEPSVVAFCAIALFGFAARRSKA